MKIIIIGLGEYYNRYKSYLENAEILAIADNDKSKQGCNIDGKVVVSVEDAVKLNYDKVVILNRFFNEITDQLLSLGVNEKDIVLYYDLRIINESRNKKNILIISDEFKLSGAQVAAANAAILLKNNGYNVTVASNADGPIRELLWKYRIPIIIDPKLIVETLSKISWTQDFDLIIINTIIPYHLLFERNIDIPVIWWIHECEEGYEFVCEKHLSRIDMTNIFVCGVSKVAKEAFCKRVETPFESLTIGVDNNLANNYSVEKNKYRFIFVGEICSLKGHDILAKAIKELPKNIQDEIEVLVIGRKDNSFKELQCDLENINCVRVLGEIPLAKMPEMYEACDALICASRMESLSTVVIEAMMHKKVAIVSSAAGIVDYLVDENNAIIFPSEDYKVLAEKMIWCINNENVTRQIGEMAFQTYEKYFAMNVFEKNLLEIVSNVLNRG